MNLMFWKKKTGDGEEAEAARENLAVDTRPRETLDFVAASQDAAGHDREPSEPESSDADEAALEAPAKQGWLARMKLRLDAMALHFKKPAAFRAEEDRVPEAPGDAEKPEDATDMEPDLEPGAPARPGLAERIKLQVIAFARRFRKTPAPDADEEHGDEAEPADKSPTPGKPGLLMRTKAAFAAFIRELKAPSAPAAGEEEETGSHGRSEAVPEGEPDAGEEVSEPVRSKRWLVIGGSIVVVLLLAGIVIANWPIFEPPQKRWGTRHDITSISSRPIQPGSSPDDSQAPAPEQSQAEIEALMKKNAELQARLDALKLKKGSPQQPSYMPPAMQTGASAPQFSESGDMVVGNKDPKATAMSLKEAIEAMNAGTGDYDKKPAK